MTTALRPREYTDSGSGLGLSIVFFFQFDLFDEVFDPVADEFQRNQETLLGSLNLDQHAVLGEHQITDPQRVFSPLLRIPDRGPAFCHMTSPPVVMNLLAVRQGCGVVRDPAFPWSREASLPARNSSCALKKSCLRVHYTHQKHLVNTFLELLFDCVCFDGQNRQHKVFLTFFSNSHYDTCRVSSVLSAPMRIATHIQCGEV